MLSKTNLEILVKIIYAVETGGQFTEIVDMMISQKPMQTPQMRQLLPLEPDSGLLGRLRHSSRKLKRKILILSKSWTLRVRLRQILRVQIGVSTS